MRSIEPPSRVLFWLEGRALLELLTLPFWLPVLRRLPKGDGHPVLVVPGLLAGAPSTAPLRWFLSNRGYSPARWRLGRNLGYSPALDEAMNAHVRELAERSGSRVSLLGWSLGGVYAREIARRQPERVRQVITFGSPFRGRGTGSRAAGVYAAVAGERPEAADPDLLARIEHPPPVPCTAVHSRSDGVVAPSAATEELEHPRVENVTVRGAHFGLGANPGVWIVVADRLAQPAGTWRPFAPRNGLEGLLCWPDDSRGR
jgi:pimeloyl-ACP methyl ester carboxylesterase